MEGAEPRAAGPTDFAQNWPTQPGISEKSGLFEFFHRPFAVQLLTTFPVEIPAVIGSEPARVNAAAAAAPERQASSATAFSEWRAPSATALPRFELPCVHEPVAGAEGTTPAVEAYAPLPCGIFLPVPAAEPAERPVEQHSQPWWIRPSGTPTFPALAFPMVPGVTPADGNGELPLVSNFAQSPGAEPVEFPVRSADHDGPLAIHYEARLPAIPRHAVPIGVAPLAQTAGIGEAAPVEGPVTLEAGMKWMQLALGDKPRLLATLAAAARPWAAEFRRPAPSAAPPSPAHMSAAALKLVPAIRCCLPQTEIRGAPETAVPQAGATPLEFYCERTPAVPALHFAWMVQAPPVVRPRFALRAAPAAWAERTLEAPPGKRQKKPAAAKVFQFPEAQRRGASWLREIAKPLAACFLMAAFLWLASTTMRVGTHIAAVNREASMFVEAEREAPGGMPVGSGRTGGAAPSGAAIPPSAHAQEGLIALVRRAIASRAASQITESFHAGMAAWGEGKGPAPAGWTRHADGYVLPGPLALFRPSLDFRDYRMEFFGQIERKGMSWAVRARNPKNYYAMKVTVVEPGLRPMIAIEHYPVVEGRNGYRVRVPLPEVMFHNHTPYRVEVAVKGNRVTTSIEGQEVDSWTDDTLAKGGVGFFADAGERARIYWLKVSKNEDFLGRICAYLSGSTENESGSIAGLRPDGIRDQGKPSGLGSLPRPAEAALAAVFDLGGPNRGRRSPSWSL
jgi:hypothetical protein